MDKGEFSGSQHRKRFLNDNQHQIRKKLTHLESEIHKILEVSKANNIVGKTLSATKNALNSSSQIVNTVHNFADNLEDGISEAVGGAGGAAAGWIAGKATKAVGRFGGGILAGALKTVAMVIPDASNPKLPETDLRIANLVETYPLSSEKNSLFELVQWLYGQINLNGSPYGKSTIKAFEKLHQRAFDMLSVVAKNDVEMTELVKAFAPKKKFGLF